MERAPNLERLALWADALDSGEFAQGKSQLRKGDSFCCLGVACEVARRNGLALGVHEDDNSDWTYDGQCGVMPHSVQRWYGLTTGNPRLADQWANVWNDFRDATFQSIARMIRDEYGLPAVEDE